MSARIRTDWDDSDDEDFDLFHHEADGLYENKLSLQELQYTDEDLKVFDNPPEYYSVLSPESLALVTAPDPVRPYVWNFSVVGEWPSALGFDVNAYWALAFTYPCESRQFKFFGFGESKHIYSSAQSPYMEHTLITPSDQVARSVSQFWIRRTKEELAFEIYKVKHVHSKRVEFWIKFSDAYLLSCIPFMKGTITVTLDEGANRVTHEVEIKAQISFGSTDGGFLKNQAGKAFNAYMAVNINTGIQHVFQRMFTQPHLMYT